MFNFSTVEGAQCYVCSWSPSDTYRADLCTRGNFSDSVRTTKCEHGCESVTVFDKNGMWTTSVGCVTRSSIVFEPGEMTQFYKGETPNHLVRLGLEPKPKRQFASSLTRRKIGSPHPVRKQIRSPCPAINTVNATTGFHINSPPPWPRQNGLFLPQLRSGGRRCGQRHSGQPSPPPTKQIVLERDV